MTKDEAKTKRCVSIAGYWNNESQDGLSLTVGSTEPGVLDDVLELLNTLIVNIAKVNAPKKDILRFLAEKAKNQNGDDAEKLFILATIAYLEESGQLESDEYNGMVYMYLDDEGGIEVDRRDKPPSIH